MGSIAMDQQQPPPQRPSQPTRIRLENLPAGADVVGAAAPRLSWQFTEAPPGWSQAAFEISASVRPRGGLPEVGRPILTNLVVDTAEQTYVPWPLAPLSSRDQVSLRLRVCGDGDGSDAGWSRWSEEVEFETPLLQAADWHASWIRAPWRDPPGNTRRPPLLRQDFTLAERPRRARVYVSARGLVELELNGHAVDIGLLVPGWTPYHERTRYAVADVTDLLLAGENVIGAWLGDGWYRGRYGFEGGASDLYGSDLELLAQLEVELSNGDRLDVVTDGDWHASFGPIRHSGLYDGESYDDRLTPVGWSRPGHDATGWEPVEITGRDVTMLVPYEGPAVERMEVLRPVSVRRLDADRHLLDFGQNHSGRLRIHVDGPVGSRIVLRHAEVLQEGELYTRPLRDAAATDTLILAGRALDWEPRFTIHGYRYAEVTGWPGEPADDDIVSVVCHSALPTIGHFACSDPDLEQLHRNIVWSARSNLVDIPTDCPQRDERLGWTGDFLLFAPSAAFLFDVNGFAGDWLTSLAIEQDKNGTTPWYVPWIPGNAFWDPTRTGAVWGDAAVLVPWCLYQATGETRILERQWESARHWVDQILAESAPAMLFAGRRQVGDWLDPGAPADQPELSRTDPVLIATAYLARSTSALADIAAVLGRRADSAHYRDRAARVRQAFADAFVHDDGTMSSDTQTAYAIAIVFGLAPERHPSFHRRLAELVLDADATIATGFAGTPLICEALTRAGRTDLAYRLILQRSCPSWLYPVSMGATTVWERWDSMLPDGTVNPGDMTSFNHYALGSIAQWMHESIAGLRTDAPGYSRIRFAPRPGGGLTWAAASHLTPRGTAAIRWESRSDGLRMELSVPVGADAVVDIEGHPEVSIGPGDHEAWVSSDGISVTRAAAADLP